MSCKFVQMKRKWRIEGERAQRRIRGGLIDNLRGASGAYGFTHRGIEPNGTILRQFFLGHLVAEDGESIGTVGF